MLLIKNGTIIDPFQNLEHKSDILIGDCGNIIEISEKIESNCESFDATNMYISPGLIDVHVHLRNPGSPNKETIQSGTNSALAGGFTTIVCMANTNPLIDNADTLKEILTLNKTSSINILQCATVSQGFNGKTLTKMKELKDLGAVGFTDDGVNIKSSKTTSDAFKLCQELNVPISLHEEDNSLIEVAGVNFGSKFSIKHSLVGATNESESVAVARDIALAINSNAKVNFQHLSTKESVALIAFGKKMGANITAEVTPHHISLTDEDLELYGANAKMNPPLRTQTDRIALINGLKDGIIDIIATDHAPHTSDEKSRDFKNAPSGIIGLETALPVSLTYLKNDLSLMEILSKFTKGPAKLYSLTNKEIQVGNKAELCILNPSLEVVFDTFKSKSSNSPFSNQKLCGKVCATIISDKILYRG